MQRCHHIGQTGCWRHTHTQTHKKPFLMAGRSAQTWQMGLMCNTRGFYCPPGTGKWQQRLFDTALVWRPTVFFGASHHFVRSPGLNIAKRDSGGMTARNSQYCCEKWWVYFRSRLLGRSRFCFDRSAIVYFQSAFIFQGRNNMRA